MEIETIIVSILKILPFVFFGSVILGFAALMEWQAQQRFKEFEETETVHTLMYL